MNTTDENRTVLFLFDFYQGIDGPTLRIDTVLPEGLISLRNGFVRLASENSGHVQLELIAPGRFEHFFFMELINTDKAGTGRSKEITLIKRTVRGPCFCWARDSEGWIDCSMLVEKMITLGKPCHQYAGVVGSDDAVVEIAYQERARGYKDHVRTMDIR